MTNDDFLDVIKSSFETYLQVGTSRSTAKLKILHGKIAEDLSRLLGEGFSIQALGFGNDKEGSLTGRYYLKNVDITVNYKGKPVAGYAVKFVMRNYSQNSNNYFENMLGETANLRSNTIPYFQIFIIFDKVPYYKKNGKFKRYDFITQHNLEKYLKLSFDDPDVYRHTPDKTLIILIRLREKSENYRFADQYDYANYYKSIIDSPDIMRYSNNVSIRFGNTVILNDYKDFLFRSCCLIKGKLKN